jgi:hypothetical protein
MDHVISIGKEASVDIAAHSNIAFDGNVFAGYQRGWEGINKLLAIENKEQRLKAANVAYQDGLYWLHAQEHINPDISYVQNADPFWASRKIKREGDATFPAAGQLLAKVFSLLCQAKNAQATVAFHSAMAALNRLPDYDTRHDALSYAHQLMPLGLNAIATHAADDILDAFRCKPEIEGDIAFAHIIQAIDSLASVQEPDERTQAIDMARQKVHLCNGPQFHLRIAKLAEPLLDYEDHLLVEPFASVIHALVRPMDFPASKAA